MSCNSPSTRAVNSGSERHGPKQVSIPTIAIAGAGIASGVVLFFTLPKIVAVPVSGHCSSNTCALIPPKPKALTAARQGWSASRRCQSRAWSSTVNGPLSRSMPLAACSKFAIGGNRLCLNASNTLISPADPAAVSRWPILLFTDPITQRCPSR